jgi:hypothetical protein
VSDGTGAEPSAESAEPSKLRRFLAISRAEGLEALRNAEELRAECEGLRHNIGLAQEVISDLRMERDAARAKALDDAANVADRFAMLPGDCEQLGPTDSETGVRECAQERRDQTCWCEERAQQAADIRDAIRALAMAPLA